MFGTGSDQLVGPSYCTAVVQEGREAWSLLQVMRVKKNTLQSK